MIAAVRPRSRGTKADQAAGEQALRTRRRSAACSAGAATILGVVTTYQTGIVTSLPEPPGRWFDA